MPDDPTSQPNDVLAARARTLWATAAAAALGVIVVYLVFVCTRWGQEVDDLALEGRAAVSLRATQRTDRLLGTVTEESLFLLGGAIVLIALARRRVWLAVAVGVAMSGAVLTTEVLKLEILGRPMFTDVQGLNHNSYPSGHATIGMVLSLGLVMVAPRRRRWLAAIAAGVVSAAFGTAVLASGWHRPSDSIGAALVALAWFAGVTAVLTARRARVPRDDEQAAIDERSSPAVVLAAGAAVLAFLVVALWQSIEADGLRTVAYAGRYAVACIVIDAVGLAVVAGYFWLTRDLVLGVPPDAAPLRSDQPSDSPADSLSDPPSDPTVLSGSP